MSQHNHKKSKAQKAAREPAQRAELAGRLGAPQTASHEEFGVIIHRSARTVSRYVRRGLPVIVPGVIDVAAAIQWLKARGLKGHGRVGRPRNIDLGLKHGRDGGAR